MTAPRVLVVDDQTLIRTGFRLILTARGIEVVGEAADGAEAVSAARELRPDVILMDIRMPTMDGLEATRRILQHLPDCRVLMLTTFDLDHYVYTALSIGASGFLLKDVTPEHLASAVRLVDTGDALLAPSITRRLVERFADTAGRAATGALAGLAWLPPKIDLATQMISRITSTPPRPRPILRTRLGSMAGPAGMPLPPPRVWPNSPA